MATRHAHDLLLDSEATLRLVGEAVVDELKGFDPAHARAELRPMLAQQGPGMGGLTELLLKAYAEITTVVQTLRESRGLLQQNALDRLHVTNEKIREVTSATETAATDIMDSVDRALATVDELETKPAADLSDEASTLRASLRDELYGVMNHLQFQDITTQQLTYASTILDEMERRLAGLSELFDPQLLGVPEAPVVPSGPVNYDPAATVLGAEFRQAVADEIFQQP